MTAEEWARNLFIAGCTPRSAREFNMIVATIHRAMNESREEGIREGRKQGREEARAIIGAPMDDDTFQRLFPTMDTRIVNHIDFLQSLIGDMMEESSQYNRGVRDGLTKAIEVSHDWGFTTITLEGFRKKYGVEKEKSNSYFAALNLILNTLPR